jgi:hypothetical protein
MSTNLLVPGQCGDPEDCIPCDECEEAPSRTFCQYRSGTYGQTVTTRPTVAVHVEVSGTQAPGCGTCDYEIDLTYSCQVFVSDLDTCTYNADVLGFDQKDFSVAVFDTPTGFRVEITDSVSHRGVVVGRRRYVYTYAYDAFSYTDCDGDPVTDANGSVNFSLVSSSVNETYHVELCWIEVDEFTVTNN